MATEKLRVNVYVTEEMKSYLQEQSEALGVSISGFINVCVNNYRQQSEAVLTMSAMQKMIEELKSIKDKNE